MVFQRLIAIVIGCLSLSSTFMIHTETLASVVRQDLGWIDGRPLFADVSDEAGINARHMATVSNDIPTGQAWGDYDRDGWLDLYVTTQSGSNTLYHNNQDGSFSVAPMSDVVALPNSLSSGAVFADYDNDGWSDLYVLARGRNTLFHNQGGTGFVDVTVQAGVGDEGEGSTAAWGDYDSDGFIDLFVSNLGCQCADFYPTGIDRLYHNNGDGTFTDMSHLLGDDEMLAGTGFAASFADIDNDGDLDLYLVNDAQVESGRSNFLWRNDGAGCGGWCFTNISAESGAGIVMNSMGLATSDYDNDGDLDFYISNKVNMVLLQNQGDGTFIDRAAENEVTGIETLSQIGWGTVSFDMDNNGFRDFYMTLSAGGLDLMYLNNGDGSFTNLTPPPPGLIGRGGSLAASGVAYADYDNDGWVDMVVGRYNGRYILYHNQSAMQGQHHWLTVNLVGGGAINRDAIGGRVYVTTTNGITQMQEVKSGSSLGAGNALALYFGLGEDTIETITVVWPDGLTQQFDNISHNRQITFEYPV